MIIEIQIPDVTYQLYGKSKEALEQRLIATEGREVDPKLVGYNLSSEQLAALRRHFGPNIKDATALVNLILKVGSIKLQKAAFNMDADQIEGTVTQAYFLAQDGEPRDRTDPGFTKAEHAVVVQRYVQSVLNDALNIVLGLN